MLTAQEFIDKLIPNFWSFLIQLLALVVLIIATIFLAYKPVKKMLAKRQEHIEENILQAEEAKAKAIIHEREASQLLLDKRKEADEIISNAVKAAEIKKETIIKSANDEIVVMKEKARQEIEQEVEDARTKLHNEIIDIALDASAHLLKREVSSEDNERLVKDFIEDIK